MTTKQNTYDMGGQTLELGSLSLGHDSPQSTGNLIYDGSDDSVDLPGTLDVTGNVTLDATLVGSIDTRAGAGAVSLTSLITLIESDSADALTLADGTEGQIKILIMTVDAGDATLTPTNLFAGTTILFDAVGETAFLVFADGEWNFISGSATLNA